MAYVGQPRERETRGYGLCNIILRLVYYNMLWKDKVWLTLNAKYGLILTCLLLENKRVKIPHFFPHVSAKTRPIERESGKNSKSRKKEEKVRRNQEFWSLKHSWSKKIKVFS